MKNIKNREEILKVIREKRLFIYKGLIIELIVNFLLVIIDVKR